MGKRKDALSYIDALRRLHAAGMADAPKVNAPMRSHPDDVLLPLEQRVDKILGIVNSKSSKPGYMLFFIMYDITSNKVRRQVVKYLERSGCMRIQKSIFLANLPAEKFREIKENLTEVQALYDNEDSIVVCPIAGEQLKGMKVIGKTIDVDLVTQSRNTLFF